MVRFAFRSDQWQDCMLAWRGRGLLLNRVSRTEELDNARERNSALALIRWIILVLAPDAWGVWRAERRAPEAGLDSTPRTCYPEASVLLLSRNVFFIPWSFRSEGERHRLEVRIGTAWPKMYSGSSRRNVIVQVCEKQKQFSDIKYLQRLGREWPDRQAESQQSEEALPSTGGSNLG